MPTILTNRTSTIEINFNVNLQHIVVKGSFDVTVLDGTDGATTVKYVWLLFRRAGQIKDNIQLDWRDISEPSGITSAEDLRDLILGWNITPAIITSSALPVGAATSDNQTNGSQKTQIVDVAGNDIVANQNVGGDYYLGSSIIQSVRFDPNNSSIINLTSANSYTFTGVATSTLGDAALQWSLKTDQNATVYIEESDDGTNWDISYAFDYIASKGGRGETIQAVKAYWRIRVVLTVSIDTTYFRLSGVLCPIANPLPSSLSPDGRLKSENTLVGKENTNRYVWVTAANELSVQQSVRLVGSNFDGTAKDPNFYTEAVTGTGSVAQSGEIEIATGTTANSTAKYSSNLSGRFVTSSALKFQSQVKFVTQGTVDNVRRIGAYDTADGYFFQLDGSTFSVGWRSSASDTLVSSGSFNGNKGATFTPLNSTYYKLEIEWGPRGVFFYVDGILLHKNGAGHLTGKLSLPITIENINDNGQATNVIFDLLAWALIRLGNLVTQPISKYIGSNATNVCKYGAGVLQRILNVDNAGLVTVYDNTAASGTILAIIDAAKVLGGLEFNIPFSIGLTIVTASGAKIVVIYE